MSNRIPALPALLLTLVLVSGSPAWADFRAPAAVNNDAPIDGPDAGDAVPSIASNGAGLWIAVWISDKVTPDGSDLYYARSLNNGLTWSDPAPIPGNPALGPQAGIHPAIAGDQGGNWVVVWTGYELFGQDLVVSYSTDDGESWSLPESLLPGSASASSNLVEPRIATDGAGTWFVAWECVDPFGVLCTDTGDIHVSRSTNHGLDWSAAHRVNDLGASAHAPDGATDGALWLVTWYGSGIRVALGDGSEAGWSAPVLVRPAGVGPRIAADAAGDWKIVLYDFLPPGFLEILVASSTGGEAWSIETLDPMAAGDTVADVLPEITSDGLGNWVVAWIRVEDPEVLMASTRTGGGNWTTPVLLNPHGAAQGANETYQALGSDGHGRVMAVWGSDDDLDGTVGHDQDVLHARTSFAPSSCTDQDGDGYGAFGDPTCDGGTVADCDDGNGAVAPDAPEASDGIDNQCPGDVGYGLVDEVATNAQFLDSATFCWAGLAGAMSYEVANSATADFSASCSSSFVSTPCYALVHEPGFEGLSFLLVRVVSPYPGSWGIDSFGQERSGVCP